MQYILSYYDRYLNTRIAQQIVLFDGIDKKINIQPNTKILLLNAL